MKRLITIIFVFLLAWLPVSTIHAQQADVKISYQASTNQANVGDEITVDVKIDNPSNQPITTVRSWLEYDSDDLEVVSLDTNMSPFTLAAPGEDMAVPEENLIKIGRSKIGSAGVTDPEVLIVKLRFKVKTQDQKATTIRPHDYQVDQTGRTTVNLIEEGLPLSILSEEPTPLSITLNNSSTQVVAEQAITTQEPFQVEVTDDLQRPEGLLLNVGESSAELKWDIGLEPQLSGYFLYYGKTSGLYTRRVDVGLTGSAFLDELNKGQIHYFSVTAYDTGGTESDYANEVAGIIGEPGSSTAPFEDLLNQLLAELPEAPENGPLAWWIVVVSIGLSWLWLKRRKGHHRSGDIKTD